MAREWDFFIAVVTLNESTPACKVHFPSFFEETVIRSASNARKILNPCFRERGGYI
jgi:hypothetical protein